MAIDSLTDIIRNRRWWRHSVPFPHVVGYDVLHESVYDNIVRGFEDLLGTEGSGYLAGHDIHGRTLTAGYDGPLTLFTTRPWHDMLSNLVAVQATGHVNCGLHYHHVDSASGFPHNDLNPGWFLDYPSDDGIRLAEPRICDYTNGRLLSQSEHPVRETVRAVAAIFYLGNPPWSAGDGGGTGLYRNASDGIDTPVAAVPPINNSILVFECTPFSYHGFIKNHRQPRKSVVLWLHRPKADAVRRWGEAAIVDYIH